jgi:hypothetical protein
MRMGRQGRDANDMGKEEKKNGVLSIADSVEMVDITCTSFYKILNAPCIWRLSCLNKG